jgi:hypothetical protein
LSLQEKREQERLASSMVRKDQQITGKHGTPLKKTTHSRAFQVTGNQGLGFWKLNAKCKAHVICILTSELSGRPEDLETRWMRGVRSEFEKGRSARRVNRDGAVGSQDLGQCADVILMLVSQQDIREIPNAPILQLPIAAGASRARVA